jgi:hypothetical protein
MDNMTRELLGEDIRIQAILKHFVVAVWREVDAEARLRYSGAEALSRDPLLSMISRVSPADRPGITLNVGDGPLIPILSIYLPSGRSSEELAIRSIDLSKLSLVDEIIGKLVDRCVSMERSYADRMAQVTTDVESAIVSSGIDFTKYGVSQQPKGE